MAAAGSFDRVARPFVAQPGYAWSIALLEVAGRLTGHTVNLSPDGLSKFCEARSKLPTRPHRRLILQKVLDISSTALFKSEQDREIL